MKKLTFILLLPITLFAQEEVKVYETKNGIQNIHPSTLITSTGEVYNLINGLPTLLPTFKIEVTPNNSSVNVLDLLKRLETLEKAKSTVTPTPIKTYDRNNRTSQSNLQTLQSFSQIRPR
jgi:hypothetical protein